MKYKHYAPKGALTLVEGADLNVVSAKINELVAQDVAAGKKAAVIATQESKARYQAPIVLTMGCRSDSASVAHECFSILREMDTLGVDVIYCESFEREALGQAIMNRLLKAAGYRVLRL
jgi:L-threonylcarbamoyladenylate synthase